MLAAGRSPQRFPAPKPAKLKSRSAVHRYQADDERQVAARERRRPNHGPVTRAAWAMALLLWFTPARGRNDVLRLEPPDW